VTSGEAGLARAEGPHRVEEVGDRARPAGEGRARLGCRRVRVAAGDGDPPAPQEVDQLERPRQLRGERHVDDRPGADQPLEQRRVGIAPSRCGVAAQPLGREERPLEMRAEHARRGAVLRNLAQRRDELFLGRRDEGRLIGGDTRAQQRLADAPVALGVSGEEVDADEAVHLKVDEAGRRDPAPVPAVEPASDDPPIRDLDVAGNELAAEQRRFDSEPHG